MSITFRFATPVVTDVVYGLFDVSGCCVQHLFDGRISAGTQSVAIDGSELDTGIYFIKSQSADVSLSRKCIVMK